MSQRAEPPFRADHVGSLLRPPRAARGARATARPGAIDADELREVEDAAIRDVVRMQEDVGLQSATDGEFRRTSWHMDFIYQLGGVTQTDENDPRALPQRRRRPRLHARRRCRSTGRIGLDHTIFGDDFAFLRRDGRRRRRRS